MCEPGPHLKLCTCGFGAALPRPRWRLSRQTAKDAAVNADRVLAVGSFVPPPMEAEMLREAVLRDVNRSDAFDVDPGAIDGDTLVLDFETETVVLVREGGRWRKDGPLETQASGRITQGRIERTD